MFMEKRRPVLATTVLIFVLAAVLSACSIQGGANSNDSMGSSVQTEPAMEEDMSEDAIVEEGEHDSMMDEDMSEDAAMEEDISSDAMMSVPAFFNVPLIEATSGETFTLADFKGKVVLVENMAIWCSTCFRQQKEVVALHELLGEREDFVSVGLDIDPNEGREALMQYTAENEFHWIYTVAPREVAREIGEEYGAQFLNPPSAPMFIIDRGGNVHTLPFGIKSAEDLQRALEPFLSEGM